MPYSCVVEVSVVWEMAGPPALKGNEVCVVEVEAKIDVVEEVFVVGRLVMEKGVDATLQADSFSGCRSERR